MSRHCGIWVVVVAVLIGSAFPGVVAGPFDRYKKKAQEAAAKVAEDEVEKQATKIAECIVGDEECVKEAEAQGQEVVLVDEEGNEVESAGGVTEADSAATAPDAGAAPGEGVWRNYDFTPGRDVWKHIVFDRERIGRFPAGQLEYVKGNMQIVEKDGTRVLEVSAASVFRVVLDDTLPDGFTLEFELQIGAPNISTYVYFSPIETSAARYEGYYLHLYHSPGVANKGLAVSQIKGQQKLSEEMTPIRLQVDGEYTILYVGTERAANIPNAKFPRSKIIEFHVNGNANLRSYVSDISVAVGVDDLYEALMNTGTFTTRGIYFDVGSARIRPESTPTLVRLEETMSGNPDLKVLIEGHTDSTGEEAANQQLSEARAKAVVDYLVSGGIDDRRLGFVGRGESQPVADNATPEGRQQNRRVVISVQE